MFERLRRVSVYEHPELGRFELLRTSYFGSSDYELKLPKGSSCERAYMRPGESPEVEIVSGRKARIYRDGVGYHISVECPLEIYEGVYKDGAREWKKIEDKKSTIEICVGLPTSVDTPTRKDCGP